MTNGVKPTLKVPSPSNAEPDGDEDGSQRPVLADKPQACPPLVTILPHADAPSS